VPTLKESAPRFINGHPPANRQKPSGIAAKETVLRVAALGESPDQSISKTVNNALSVLSVLLKKAVEWDVIERMPRTIRLLPIPKGSAGFTILRRRESNRAERS
jgi:hypothetical protein